MVKTLSYLIQASKRSCARGLVLVLFLLLWLAPETKAQICFFQCSNCVVDACEWLNGYCYNDGTSGIYKVCGGWFPPYSCANPAWVNGVEGCNGHTSLSACNSGPVGGERSCISSVQPTPTPPPGPPPPGNPPPPPGSTPTPTPGPVGRVQGRTAVVSWGLVNAQTVAGLVGSGKTVTVGTAGSDVVDPTNDGTGRTVYSVNNITLNNENHTTTITSDPIAGYETGYSLCYNQTTCHDNAAVADDFLYSLGNSVTVSEASMNNGNPNPYADLWWHYLPLPTCSISGPSSIPINETGSYSVSSAIPDPGSVVVDHRTNMSWNTSKNTTGGNAVSTNGCGDNSGCAISNAQIDPDALGLSVGDTIYAYCRSSNGLFTNSLHGCNPFHTESPKSHPYDANCGNSDWIEVTIAPSSAPPICSAPTLSVSEACASGSSTNNTWSWNSIAGAQSYRLQVDDTSNFSSPLEVNTVTPFTQYTQSNVSATTVWYARVRVETSNGTTCTPPSAYSGVTQTDGVNQCMSCTIGLVPSNPADLVVNDTQAFSTLYTQSGGTITSVGFTSTSPLIASLSPTTDPSAPFATTATGNNPGTTTIRATATMSNGTTTCQSNPVSLTVVNPSCTVTLNPQGNPYEMELGTVTPFSVNPVASPASASVTNVQFSSDNISVVEPVSGNNPENDNTSPYVVNYQPASGASPGQTANITADVEVNGIPDICTDTTPVEIKDVSAWWQVAGGDATTSNASGADLSSDVPTFFDPLLKFMTNGTSNHPGVPAYGGTSSNVFCTDPADPDNCNVSDQGWIAEADGGTGGGLAGYDALAGEKYDYDYFTALIPNGIVPRNIAQSNLTGAQLASAINGATADANGYKWIFAQNAAGLTVGTSNVNVGTNKAILFVEQGDFTINRNIALDEAGGGFLMVISNGGINVGATPTSLEGLFVSDGPFNSCASGVCATKLTIRGSVVTWSPLNLGRDLESVNQNFSTPAEVFQFAPDLILNYPTALSLPSIDWKEVVP